MSNIPTAAPEEQMFPEPGRESVGDRLRRAALRALGHLAPGLPAPRRCRPCGVVMELLGDLVYSEDNPALVEAVRFWSCPQCGDGVREWYCYPRYPDTL